MGFVSAALGTLYVCVSIYLGYNVNWYCSTRCSLVCIPIVNSSQYYCKHRKSATCIHQSAEVSSVSFIPECRQPDGY